MKFVAPCGPALQQSPKLPRRIEAIHFLCLCPLLASGSSLPPSHFALCFAAEEILKELGLTGLAVQSRSPFSAALASAASRPGVWTSPFLWSLAETQKLLLMSTSINCFSSQNVTLLLTFASILPGSPAPCGCYLLRCFRQHSCNILLPKCPFDLDCKVLQYIF